MKQEINIADILKDAPKGTELYSTILGECTFDHISGGFIWVLSPKCDVLQAFTKEGHIVFKNTWCSEVCCLFPNRHFATWNDFKAPWKHKHFEPFQRVIVKLQAALFDSRTIYAATLYSHYDEQRKQHFTFNGFIDDSDILPYEGNEDKLGKVIH